MCKLIDKTKEQYKGVLEIFSSYWSAYGGWGYLITSPYLHFSLIISMITVGLWWDAPWWDISISTLPNLLGFSLGGYAISLTLGDDKFQTLLTEKDEEIEQDTESPYIQISASFLHFVLMQFFSLIVSFLFRSISVTFNSSIDSTLPINILTKTINYFGYSIFIYSLMTGVAASIAIFNYSKLFDIYKSSTPTDEK